jgi:hypothetical protein
VRDLVVRFLRPYAVVAVTHYRPRDGDPWREPWTHPWNGLPVFSGWIERADNAT